MKLTTRKAQTAGAIAPMKLPDRDIRGKVTKKQRQRTKKYWKKKAQSHGKILV